MFLMFGWGLAFLRDFRHCSPETPATLLMTQKTLAMEIVR